MARTTHTTRTFKLPWKYKCSHTHDVGAYLPFLNELLGKYDILWFFKISPDHEIANFFWGPENFSPWTESHSKGTKKHLYPYY